MAIESRQLIASDQAFDHQMKRRMAYEAIGRQITANQHSGDNLLLRYHNNQLSAPVVCDTEGLALVPIPAVERPFCATIDSG